MSRGQRRRRVLTREEIVATGLAIADEEGLDAVSMRRVAMRLRVGTMTLYHHVADKDHLLELMADAIGGEMLVPELPSCWRDAVREISIRTRDVFLAHPWLVDSFGRKRFATPNALRHVEQSAQAVSSLDVDRETATALLFAADDYTFGYVLRERMLRQWRTEEERGPMKLTPELEALVASGELPHVAQFIAAGPPKDRPASNYELGLDCLLDGFEALVERARPDRRTRSRRRHREI